MLHMYYDNDLSVTFYGLVNLTGQLFLLLFFLCQLTFFSI